MKRRKFSAKGTPAMMKNRVETKGRKFLFWGGTLKKRREIGPQQRLWGRYVTTRVKKNVA